MGESLLAAIYDGWKKTSQAQSPERKYLQKDRCEELEKVCKDRCFPTGVIPNINVTTSSFRVFLFLSLSHILNNINKGQSNKIPYWTNTNYDIAYNFHKMLQLDVAERPGCHSGRQGDGWPDCIATAGPGPRPGRRRWETVPESWPPGETAEDAVH
jgi:hypothetical protein